MRTRAKDHFSAHGQRISQSEIPHREALRCRSMLLRHDAPASVNATSPQASTPPEASVTSTTIRRRRADVILHDDG
ncbi:unnamed protein product [Miscanthus lutarioriparius]|uniref:Uncharacterized protein n=1 Tax=Miscanthus lutarioriparius TaxID=422564 RepID=A0A811NA38_9POAL|nr:unnamed protein product [Miscanthus lutarioriparius]